MLEFHLSSCQNTEISHIDLSIKKEWNSAYLVPDTNLVKSMDPNSVDAALSSRSNWVKLIAVNYLNK